MARAFVAIVPPPDVVAAIMGATTATRTSIDCDTPLRWVAPDQLHITLAFLGDHADLGDVTARLAGFAVPAFATSLQGLGAFPRPRAARVLWMGVCAGRAEMAGASAAIHARLAVRPDQRFTAHLTLARSRVPRDLSGVVGRDRAAIIEWNVDEIVVFESTLGRRGAVHRAHARIPLS